jgi:hypothetical protein
VAAAKRVDRGGVGSGACRRPDGFRHAAPPPDLPEPASFDHTPDDSGSLSRRLVAPELRRRFLTNVLGKFFFASGHDRNVGYSQGINYSAAVVPLRR